MTAWPARQLLFATLILTLAVGRIPAHAQTETYRIGLPALYRQLALLDGQVLTLVTSRLAPDIHLAVVIPLNVLNPTYNLLRSQDGGLIWTASPSEPWDQMAPAPQGTWGDIFPPRLLRVNGVLTLVTMPVWISPPTLFVSQDLGQSWVQRDLPAPAGCAGFRAGQLLQTPASPDRLVLTGWCRNSTTRDEPILVASNDAGLTWIVLDSWVSGEPTWINDYVTSATDGELLYRRQGANWQRSRDLATTWENLSIPGERLIISPNNADVIAVVGPWFDEGSTSLDGGRTWRRWRNLPCGLSDSVAPIWLRGQTETLLAACLGGGLQGQPVIRSHDGGQTWESVPLPLSEQRGEMLPLPAGELTFLVADDGHANGLYIVTEATFEPLTYKLHRSLDAGDTWQDVLAFGWP